MQPPTTGAHLQQFICAIQWVKTGIPDFSYLIAPLQNFMEKVYDRAGKRTNRAVASIKLRILGWGKQEQKTFQRFKKSLANLVTLAHRDEEQRLCIYTDASDVVWSAIVTQVPYEDLDKRYKQQRHSPLAFCSGNFNATQVGWSTLEKEGYAIMETIARMHWLAATVAGLHLFMDHNNLIFCSTLFHYLQT